MKGKLTRKELKHDGLVDTVFSAGRHFQKYGKVYLSLGAFLAILAIVVGASFYRRSRRVEKAALLLARPRSPLVLEEIYRDYPETKSAPLALLLLADILYQEKRYQEAGQKYQIFVEKYFEHDFAPLAQMGLAYCRESEGNWEEAISGYRELGERFPQSFLAAESLYNIARCQERLGRLEEAANSYQEVIALYRRSPYLRLAGEQLVRLKNRMDRPEED
jgi:tetratricopeptide (TPR) repeat protein